VRDWAAASNECRLRPAAAAAADDDVAGRRGNDFALLVWLALLLRREVPVPPLPRMLRAGEGALKAHSKPQNKSAT